MARRIRYDAWQGAADWRSGVLRGTRVDGDTLVMDVPFPPPGELDDLESAVWVSPRVTTEFRFSELVSSWSAVTPPGSWVEVTAVGDRAHLPSADNHLLGAWSSGERPECRTSVPRREDPETDVDLWRPDGGSEGYGLVVRLLRRPGADSPLVRSVAAVTSAGVVRSTTSAPLRRRERILDVPRLSQMTWKEVGGAGWCAPTAVSMVLSHAGRLPPGTDIPAAAREVFDPAYDGTGNWSFNTAWAATLADHAFVTRLHDLREAEAFVDAGIPLVASVAFAKGALTGAPVAGTDGHLLVICGFTESGDVVVNDPAAPSERSVRRTYDRGQLERAWLDGSGGTVFVVHNDDQAPPRSDVVSSR